MVCDWITPYSCSASKQKTVSHQICGKSPAIEIQKFLIWNLPKSELGEQGKIMTEETKKRLLVKWMVLLREESSFTNSQICCSRPFLYFSTLSYFPFPFWIIWEKSPKTFLRRQCTTTGLCANEPPELKIQRSRAHLPWSLGWIWNQMAVWLRVEVE